MKKKSMFQSNANSEAMKPCRMSLATMRKIVKRSPNYAIFESKLLTSTPISNMLINEEPELEFENFAKLM